MLPTATNSIGDMGGGTSIGVGSLPGYGGQNPFQLSAATPWYQSTPAAGAMFGSQIPTSAFSLDDASMGDWGSFGGYSSLGADALSSW